MFKIFSQIFEFIRNFIHFIKIILMFCIIMLLLFWIQNLIAGNWAWMNFIKPILIPFVKLGEFFSKNSLNLLGAVFEYKYAIAIIIYLILVYVCNLLLILTDFIDDKIDDSRRIYNKIQENNLNRSLKIQHSLEQSNINKYKILIKTCLKNKFSHPNLGYNLDEQNKIMNKFLIEKTGVNPEIFEGGFLYSFFDFNNIDKILDVFNKLLKSDSPLDYIICVQIFSNNVYRQKEQLKYLLSLKQINKIITLSDTSYRYKFKQGHKYGTTQIGLYQRDSGTYEVFEFVEI